MKNLNKFKIRLKELRKQKGLTQNDLAKELGIVRTAIANYETGRTYPDSETLFIMANILETTIDYLLGRTDIKNPQESKIINNTFDNLDVSELPDEAIEEVKKYIELIKLKYKPDKTSKK